MDLAVQAADAAVTVPVGQLLPISEEAVGRRLGDDWEFVYRNAEYLLWGAVISVLLTVTSILLGFLAGFPAGAIETYGNGYSRAFVRKFGVLLRGTPILVIMFITFYALPYEIVHDAVEALFSALDFVLGPTPFTAAVDVPGAFVAATLALGFRSAAYQSQIFRGALQSIDEGQMEAARSIGMSRLEAIRHVIAPQALRRSVPGFQNEFTIVLKDTSIAFAIGLAELLKRSEDLFTQQTTAILEVIVFISLLYFVLTFTTNRTLDYVNNRFAIPGESS
ncbi:polar amino acid ABC transporter, inner membrane subunit [Haloterrigena turkmenica DSM 5511]|uniref:Polar amino acid ABC transporter, inner membrane subunit n=1 Tax=Haloterrigena turkmenica (strain ATCC 51198 / DSM 5511 / JCM 9101 / NCIMB 13204 / VKM B-1734 / 4k) TaxID=543526 RepID=D2RTI2_HALTV|nr:amino acid ABC transporter permease [Haloterrigena turkmenica]ADB59025.1 polar amino acid ABC transporter, inner membrane subunit [Haloterrigena turkmenica DSM 5511]